jgi:hypothetical protein
MAHDPKVAKDRDTDLFLRDKNNTRFRACFIELEDEGKLPPEMLASPCTMFFLYPNKEKFDIGDEGIRAEARLDMCKV